jgi:hypothetical protein
MALSYPALPGYVLARLTRAVLKSALALHPQSSPVLKRMPG